MGSADAGMHTRWLIYALKGTWSSREGSYASPMVAVKGRHSLRNFTGTCCWRQAALMIPSELSLRATVRFSTLATWLRKVNNEIQKINLIYRILHSVTRPTRVLLYNSDRSSRCCHTILCALSSAHRLG